jgi:simple sugar transport system permease protein
MGIELVRRPERSRLLSLTSPLIALALAIVVGGIIFALIGLSPFDGLYTYFVQPLTQWWSIGDLIVKMTPLLLIAVGLAICYLSNNWNIGAEGQLAIGAICGSAIAVYFPTAGGPLVIFAMVLLGVLGGMAWGAIPALLKVRFGANEILTSLMLGYIAQYLLDWVARSPWRDPHGHNFPNSRIFSADQVLPTIFGLRLNLYLAIVVAIAAWFMLRNMLTGFQIRVLGQAPRAGAFAGFSRDRMTIIAFLISGGLAGLAGISEVMGPLGQLKITVSPGYGFTAIIVAFLGRLNPLGIIAASFVLALSMVGGQAVQIKFHVSSQFASVFQGVLMFLVLITDTLIFYRIRFVRSRQQQVATAGAVHGSG